MIKTKKFVQISWLLMLIIGPSGNVIKVIVGVPMFMARQMAVDVRIVQEKLLLKLTLLPDGK